MRRRDILLLGIAVVVAMGSPAVGTPATSAAAYQGLPAAPDPGSTLHVLSDLGAIDLDPSAANTRTTRSMLSGLVVRSLTQLGYDPDRRQSVLEPDLATTLGTHNKDYTQWVFTLRKGVTFANGRPVTPADVKFGIERSFDRLTFPHGPRFSNRYFLHGHRYQGPYRTGRAYDGVVIWGQHILLKMARPFPDLPYYLASPAMSPIPPGKASNPATYKLHPWASGPYQVHSYRPGHSLLLTRNPQWQPASDPVRAQRFDAVSVRLHMQRAQIDRLILKDSGIGRTAVSLTNVWAPDYRNWASHAPDRLVKGIDPCVDMFDLDNRKVTSIAVRRALGWAYPYRDSWAAGGFISGVDRLPATNIEPPGTLGRTSYNPLDGHIPGTTNPKRAHSILAGAHRLGAVLRFAYEVDDPRSVAVKNVLVQALKTAGFRPQPYATTTADYVRKVLKNPASPVNARAVTHCSPFPTGGSVLVPPFHSTDVAGKGFGSNYSAFANSRIDRSMGLTLNFPLDQQPARWDTIDRTIGTAYFPTVVTAYHGVALMRGSAVGGAHIDHTTGMPTWSTLTLAGS